MKLGLLGFEKKFFFIFLETLNICLNAVPLPLRTKLKQYKCKCVIV